jgi:hypothetical protein
MSIFPDKNKVLEAILCLQEFLKDDCFGIINGGDYPDSCEYCCGGTVKNPNPNPTRYSDDKWMFKHDSICPVERARILLGGVC